MKAATHFSNLNYERWEATRDELYGPLPINPFTELRQDLDLSHQRLAEHIHVSKISLIRLEQGIYPDPLPSVLHYFVSQGHSELALTDSYYDFQALTRKHYFKLFGDDLSIDPENPTHPLAQLRRAGDGSYRDLSVMQVSKYICVAQSTLQYFESRWRVQKSVPKSFAIALQANGYTSSEINTFCDAYLLWRTNRKLKRAS